jgi:rod shape determining protein RodA
MRNFWRQLAIATNWPILVAVGVLSVVGVISISAGTKVGDDEARKQIIFIVVGFLLMFAMQGINYVKLGRLAWPFYLLSLGLLIWTIAPGVPRSGMLGVPVLNGASNWINVAGPFKLQPAELMKIGFCTVLARYLRFRSNYRTLGGLIPPFLVAIVPLIVILKQPDLGTALIFIPALFAMLFVAGARMRHLLTIVAVGAVFGPIAWYSGPMEKTGMERDFPVLRHFPALIKHYQRARVRAMFSNDPLVLRNAGYQQHQAAAAFGSGGFSGKGAFNTPIGKTIPEAQNDMIFALVGEQFGFVGAAVVLCAYLVLFATGLEIASATREPFGRLVAVGIVSLLGGQTFLNLMVCLRLMPVTGVTLPFVSYGGSSMLASFIAAGLLLNIGQNRPLVMAKDAFEFD